MGKVLLLVIVVAITIYLFLRLVDRRRLRPTPPPRTVAPDDDADFLRDLQRRQRRAKDEQPHSDDD